MAELNNQQPRSVAGGTAIFNDHPGSPLNVVPHNLLTDFAFNEDEDALRESKVIEDSEPISSEFPVQVFQPENENVDDSASDLNQNDINDDEDGVQNCTFTYLLSRGQFLFESMIFFLEGYCITPSYNVCSLLLESFFLW
ncbi:hypothetical protein Hdeb2414_s0145g00812921 [Helianthus debilis subsp. tardiflorus]